MNKAYNRINWENYPSDSTPLNENNLNKMDVAIDEVDNRVISLDTTKLPVATAYTMVKDVEFDEKTGVFTITKLNGSVIKIDTALEKISTNFRFDHSTQKLILTLIDGTTQEVDLSALLTQYEFTDSDTIAFTIDTSGKVVASVKKGSITQDMLEPNYLANIKVEVAKAESASISADTSAKNAKTSETNAKTSEEKAREYAEAAGGIGALISSFATGTNPTIQDSTNAPLIYGKFKGYTLQDGEPTPDNPVEINGLAKDGAIEVKTCGKNIFGGLALAQALVDSGSTNVVLDTDDKTVTFGYNTNYTDTEKKKIFSKFKENTQYTFILVGTSTANEGYTNLQVRYTDGNTKILYLTDGLYVSKADKTIAQLEYEYVGYEQTLNYEQCGIFEGVITANEFEPYTETTTAITTDAPLYEGDYIEIYADGSGKLVRKMKEVVLDGSDDELWNKSDSQKGDFYMSFTAFDVVCKPKRKDNITKEPFCSHLKYATYGLDFAIGNITVSNLAIHLWITDGSEISDIDEYKAWLAENPVTVVYELAEPTETPLTAEQLAQFKQLYTFEPVTNVFCDGEVELLYYKNTDNGETVGIVHKKAEASEKAIEDMQTEFKQLPNTFAKKSLYGDTTINVGRKADTTVGGYSTAEGRINTASGYTSHAEGVNNIASGDSAHAEGSGTTASGDSAHAEGMGTKAIGLYSHVEGDGTIAHGNSQHVQGEYNVEDTEGKYAHIVGGGTYSERKNIHTLDWEGNAVFKGDVVAHDESGNEISLRDVNDSLKWKMHTSVEGLYPSIDLPSDYNELFIEIHYTDSNSFTWRGTMFLPKIALSPSIARRFYVGYYYTDSNKFSAGFNATTSNITIVGAKYNGGSDVNVKVTVYYR